MAENPESVTLPDSRFHCPQRAQIQMLLTVEEGKLLELLKLHAGRLYVRVMCTSVLQEACQRKRITARTVPGVLIQTPCPIASVVLQCT